MGSRSSGSAAEAPPQQRPQWLQRLPEAPLYDPRFEHDACGVGFVADSTGRRSARMVGLALEALAGLTHRGAIAADAKTGDGAGIAIPTPLPFVRRLLAVTAVAPERVALGMVFLPTDDRAREEARALIEHALAAEGLTALFWRAVPVDPSVLGDSAAESCPVIEQVVVARPDGLSAAAFERRLLLARHGIEHDASTTDGLGELYLVSLSSRIVVYKGLFVGAELGRFYRDLTDPDLAVRYAVFHQRYSTNTHPSWQLAQPFRFVAHNGEINTIRGNREAMRGRAGAMGVGSFGRRLAAEVAAGWPLIEPNWSDSAQLDEALELLVAGGFRVDSALTALIPEALALRDVLPPGLAEWQAAMAARVEPWDGPAALVFSDGRRVGAMLDRNGLRPMTYEVRKDGLVVCGSEAGTIAGSAAEVLRRGRLNPGGLFVVDTVGGQVLEDAEAKHAAMAAAPVLAGEIDAQRSGSLRRSRSLATTRDATAEAASSAPAPSGTDEAAVRRRRIVFGLDAEQLRIVVKNMATAGREAVWSMGDDTPLAVLARQPRGVAAYLRQAFAQVTNPPIDPERERSVMSLAVPLGKRPRLFGRSSVDRSTRWLTLNGPVLDAAAWAALLELGAAPESAERPAWRITRIDASWPIGEGTAGLARALDRVVSQAESAARRGADLIVISDRAAGERRLPVPSLLAVGAAHAALTDLGLRHRTDIAVETGDAFDVHAIAMLIASGAGAVHPWLLLDLADEVAGSRGNEALTVEQAEANVIGALEHGLRKVLARMGISTLASYRGGQLFEVIGLSEALAERCFPAAPRLAGAADETRLAAEAIARHARAYQPPVAPPLADPGFVRFRGDGELHAFAPAVAKAIQALATGHPVGVGPGTELAREVQEKAIDDQLASYRAVVDRESPAMVRDLLELKETARPIPLSRVEPVETILERFVSSAMSLGALSPEAHQTLAIGMRRLGASANTGEGGEDPSWYVPDENGELHESAIKQVASARFGVTAQYLARAEQLEIKMAQGSKPGEGGQLPGAKATAFIAALRRGQPGMTMISPPPHHDIYSIEDLAQLIADLRAINPTARIGVKLVAGVGVGTIAAGVAKAHADYVLISGHSGGTGASPLSSIKYAGLPWELGLAEAHQVLVRQGLRDRVVLRTDGGLQTGRDVVMAALLGAEEFGFGTAALVAIGCDMARQCHLDTCPTGIATQRPDLRAKFTGTPEAVVAFFTAIAEDVRRELAALGFRRLEDAVGRTDRLAVRDDSPLALQPLVAAPEWLVPAARREVSPKRRGRISNGPVASKLDERLTQEATAQLRAGQPVHIEASVTTAERTLGARLSGELARHPGLAAGVASSNGDDPIDTAQLRLTGAAGQSFGAFVGSGIRLELTGVANDYVAKGLSGGTIVVRPPQDAGFEPSREAIAGNTCLYGATGGRLHLVGRAGIRFAVRNSGATAVVEGVGAHGCEYMTGGTIVVLGPVGRNFGAGMTGGRAYIYDPDHRTPDRIHRDSVTAEPLGAALEERTDALQRGDELRTLVEAQAHAGSPLARRLIESWPEAQRAFWLVEPVSH